MFKKGKGLAGTVKVISYLLILLPAALGFLYVYSFGVNVIAGDSWAIVPLFRELFSGRLGVSDLFAQHAEHRILFPRVAMLSLGLLTQYNSVAEMYLIQGCFLVTLVALFFVFRDSVGSRLPLVVPIAFLPIAFLVFSLRQYDNMLTGFQMTFAFVQVFSVLAFCFLYVSAGRKRFRRVAFSAALGSGTVAAFSAAQGLFVWPVGLLQLLVSPLEKPAKKWLIGVWGSFGVGEWIVYSIGYVSPTRQPSLYYVLENPLTGIVDFLTLLGSSLFGPLEGLVAAFAGQPGFALGSGLLLVCLITASLLLIHRDRKWGEYSFWIALVFFSFLVLASIVVGRAELGTAGVSIGAASKYTTFSILSVIGVYAILAKQILEENSYLTTALLGTLAVLVVLSAPVSYAEGTEAGRTMKAKREEAAFTLHTYETQPEEFLSEVHRQQGENMERKVLQLERLGYNVFSEPRSQVLPPPLSELSPVPSSALSEIESISAVEVDQENQPVSIPAEEPSIEITGWAVDAEAEDVAGGVYVGIGDRLFPAFYGVDREDLAERYGIPSYSDSGFRRAIPVSEIGTGTHELSVVVLTNDKTGYYRPDQEVALEIE